MNGYLVNMPIYKYTLALLNIRLSARTKIQHGFKSCPMLFFDRPKSFVRVLSVYVHCVQRYVCFITSKCIRICETTILYIRMLLRQLACLEQRCGKFFCVFFGNHSI